jgi:hypothetical protein
VHGGLLSVKRRPDPGRRTGTRDDWTPWRRHPIWAFDPDSFDSGAQTPTATMRSGTASTLSGCAIGPPGSPLDAPQSGELTVTLGGSRETRPRTAPSRTRVAPAHVLSPFPCCAQCAGLALNAGPGTRQARRRQAIPRSAPRRLSDHSAHFSLRSTPCLASSDYAACALRSWPPASFHSWEPEPPRR